VLEIDAEGSPCSAGGASSDTVRLPHATQTRPEVAYARAMLDEADSQRRTARSAGELDVLLLMLCIQCKKMYTRSGCSSPGDGGRHVQDRGAAFVRLRGLLLCADNDDVEGSLV
jgi:hypothetical protein